MEDDSSLLLICASVAVGACILFVFRKLLTDDQTTPGLEERPLIVDQEQVVKEEVDSQEENGNEAETAGEKVEEQENAEGSSAAASSSTSSSKSVGTSSSTSTSISSSEQGKKWDILHAEYGVIGQRKTMEDTHIALKELEVPGAEDAAEKPKHSCALFGVFDGHGGTAASEFARDHFPSLLTANGAQLFQAPRDELERAVLDLERDFMASITSTTADGTESFGSDSGTTVVTALLLDDSLYIANVGDSEAILCRGKDFTELTTVHTPKQNQQESERVLEMGGRIYKGRIGHPKLNPSFFSIAVSRAIGDVMYKKESLTDNRESGLIATPDLKVVNVEANDVLIIACDGLWDALSHSEACEFVYDQLSEGKSPVDTITALVDHAIHHTGYTGDNVTACIVILKATN